MDITWDPPDYTCVPIPDVTTQSNARRQSPSKAREDAINDSDRLHAKLCAECPCPVTAARFGSDGGLLPPDLGRIG
jgi:hypothetical protein